MRHIKPGRGPSTMGAIGSIVVTFFGIFWTIMVVQMGAPIFLVIFGVVFVILGIAQSIYHWKNATGKNRFSSFDITESEEEPDPFQQHFTDQESPISSMDDSKNNNPPHFCPYCGEAVNANFEFCPKCGKKLP